MFRPLAQSSRPNYEAKVRDEGPFANTRSWRRHLINSLVDYFFLYDSAALLLNVFHTLLTKPSSFSNSFHFKKNKDFDISKSFSYALRKQEFRCTFNLSHSSF